MTNRNRQDIIHVLHDCYSICLETFSIHCTKQGGHHMAYEHIRRMLSCIDVCALTADFLLRRFPLTQEVCDLCADVCKQCATSCDGIDDKNMDACVRVCEAAARACMDESYHLKSVAA
jgi:hypothetical protein